MISLAYLSSATRLMDPEALGTLIDHSARNNQARGIAGLLCHYDGSFLQFLEGEEDKVDALFALISKDRRHGGLIVMHRQEVSARAFPDWSMALVSSAEVGPAHQAFCRNLRHLKIDQGAENHAVLTKVLASFSMWLR
ncbi:BLUF domain-containing protein [Caulobacter sp. NIBR2454]|uniref:BLUF domain-containing protein n=1 Tax=Caulobacter sp. NIBR2454 TaxID=3015996 RepID=UPI0022B678FC|nr:BLUF domain-containing protein [Caulobacter sp. NIBR2454]